MGRWFMSSGRFDKIRQMNLKKKLENICIMACQMVIELGNIDLDPKHELQLVQNLDIVNSSSNLSSNECTLDSNVTSISNESSCLYYLPVLCMMSAISGFTIGLYVSSCIGITKSSYDSSKNYFLGNGCSSEYGLQLEGISDDGSEVE